MGRSARRAETLADVECVPKQPPSAIAIYSGSTYEGNCSPSGSVASCTIEGTVGPDTTLTADLPVINPSQGRYHATVSTSSDTQPANSNTYTIGA